MNAHQKTAFGAAGVLAVAYLIAWGFDLSGLGTLLLLAVAVALLTLPFTWKLIYGGFQLLGAVFGFLGHSIGKMGDWVADKAYERKHRLSESAPAEKRGVPGWGSDKLGAAPSTSTGAHSSFLEDALSR